MTNPVDGAVEIYSVLPAAWRKRIYTASKYLGPILGVVVIALGLLSNVIPDQVAITVLSVVTIAQGVVSGIAKANVVDVGPVAVQDEPLP